MTEGKLCPKRPKPRGIGLSKPIRQSKTEFAAWKRRSCFRNEASSATIATEFGSYMGNVGSTQVGSALTELAQGSAEITNLADDRFRWRTVFVCQVDMSLPVRCQSDPDISMPSNSGVHSLPFCSVSISPAGQSTDPGLRLSSLPTYLSGQAVAWVG